MEEKERKEKEKKELFGVRIALGGIGAEVSISNKNKRRKKR